MMKNKNLLNLVRRKSYEQTRRERFGLKSVVSRFCVVSLICLCMLTLGVGNAWGADPVATETATDGESYVVAAWTGSKYVALPNFTTGSTPAGVDITVNASGKVTTADAPEWTFTEGSTTGQFYLTYTSGVTTYYLYKNGTKNTNYNIAGKSNGDKNYWSFTKSSNKYKVLAIDRGSNNTRLTYYTSGSKWEVYGTANTYDIILLKKAAAGPAITPSVTELDWGTVNKGASLTTKTFTITGTNLTSANLVYSASGGYSVSPSGKAGAAGTLASQTLTVTPPSTATPGTYNSTVSITGGGLASAVTVTVKLTVQQTDEFIDELHSTSGYTSASPHIEGGTYSTPSIADKSVATSGNCEQLHYHFVGWITKTKYDAGTSIAVGDLQTPTTATGAKYYAVWAKQGAGSGTATGGITQSEITTAADGKTAGSYADQSASSASGNWTGKYAWNTQNSKKVMQINATSGNSIISPTFSGAISNIAFVYTNAAGSSRTFTLKDGATSIGTITASSSTTEGSGSASISGTHTSFEITASAALYIHSITVTYSSVSYEDYIAKCCDDPGLAYATGSVTKTFGEGVFTNPLTNSHSVGVTYALSSVSPAGCVSINASTGQVTINAAGSATVTASFAGNSTYCADEASYTLTVNKADISPTLSYESGTLVIGNNSSSPTVGGNSGSGTVTYAITTESTSGVVTLNTSTGVVTAAKEGTATITATIPATTNYNGGSATANFTVTCGAPSSVDISGNYQFYPGETISLTATPTGGAGTPVTYQWKKGGSPIAGATSATYTKNNATASDAGAYTCTVQYGSNCATTSDAFNLKCMQFYLKNNSGEDISNHALTKVDATHATLSLSLTGGTTYKFRVTDGCGDWYGNTGEMTSSNCTNWAMDADADCRVTTSSKSATYVFNFDFSGGLLGSEMKVSVVYPSSNQASGKVIYWDNEVNKWNGSKLWYRIGKNNHNANTQLSKVAGTANFYSVTTSQYDGFEYWHIANNQGQGTGNIFWTKDNSGSGLEITNAMGFEGAPVTDATVTVTPTTTHSTGGSSDNNNCEFYTYSITSGIKSYTVTSSATNCTVAMEKYNNDAGSSTTALASGGTVMPTQYVKVTVTPNTGYQFSSVSVTNGTTVTAAAAGTPGVYYITGNATVTATCTAKTCTVNFDKNSGSGGDASTTATYGLALPTVSVPSRTGYTFDGYWDAETNNNGSGTQYYSANGICARNWDKDVTADQTLYAKWNAKQYTIELDREGASTGAESVTATYDAGTLAGWSAPSKTGYEFGGYWSADNGTGTMVINASGVLQNSVTISSVAWTDASGHWIKDGGVTVYAKWTAEQYTITYKDQGNVAYSGSNGGSLPTTHTYGAVTALVDGVKSGYRFDGWFDNSGCTGSAITTIGGTDITANTTYYAKWTQVYTVTWYVNGDEWSSGVVSGNTQVPGGTKVSALPTAPTKSDCDDSKVFVGWKAAEIDGVSVSDPGGIFTTQGTSPTINANMDFYAVFADESGGDFTRVTNVATQIEAGKKVILGYEATANSGVIVPLQSNALNGTLLYTGTTEGSAGSGTLTMSSMSSGDEAIYAFTIRAGHNSGYWAFEMSGDNAGKYLSHNGKNSITNAESVTNDGKTDFSIVLGTNDVATITNKWGNENTTQDGKNYYNYKIFCYNYSNGNPRAAIYRATQTGDFVMYLCNPLTYSNYVTSCSSCDADATFTNTTPAVSDIDCTSATLTATGGLATLGAAGCNVSDYGFVIGTADNPAIGGSGVTKYQVGTSNPTIGEDFSYDATGLTKGTHYYIRAYAINRHGTAYSSSTNFWTNNVSSIAITTAPTKTNYLVGETFDATGMVVTATMASGATEDVTSDVTYSSSALTAGTSQNFAINYTLCETDKSVNQKINVYTLSVSEGTNPSYGSYTVDGAVITVSLEAQKTFSFATTNCSTRDNGDGTYTVINVTGNATVVINYRDAAQVKVYYKVDGTTITSLTQDVYESSQTTLPTSSALSSAMAAQGMALPDELYPNFIGWSETEFGAQTADPTIVEGTPIINAEKNYYAVYSNVNKIRIDESDITSTSYPGSEQTLTKSSKDFIYHYICKQSSNLQFKKNSSNYGYIYNNTAISNIAKIEIGASGDDDFVPVYAGSAANTISGSALTDEDISEYKYVYLFPSNTQYFIIKGDNSYTYKVDYIDIFYASSTVYYMTQFCTRYSITGASTGGTAVIVNGNTGGTLTSSHNELCEGKSLTLSAAVNAQYNFSEWKIVKTGAEPEVDLTADLLGANKTSLTPPAFSMPGYGITVSATISEKTATAWSWTYNSAAIPDPMILYVGEVKQLDVTYTPDAAQLVSAQKNYTVTKESSPVAEAGKAMNYYKMRGAAGVTEETNATVTFSLNSLVQEVNVTVKPLPSARFEDNVHNAISTTVTATVSDGVVSLTKKTPTHADISPAPASGNACEKQHLHLIGWIDGDWEPFINYMNGGSRPSDSDITTATGYFFLPNADIDLSQKGGKTYYAVWGKADE